MKKILFIAIAAVLVLSLVACSAAPAASSAAPASSAAASVSAAPASSAAASAAPAGKKFKVAVSLPQANNAWQARLLKFVNDEVATVDATKFEFTVKSAASNDDQLNVLNTLKSGGYDLIVILPGDGALLSSICEQIYDAGIKTIILDRGINSPSGKYTALLAGDNKGGGKNAADYIGDKLGGKGNVVVLRSYTGIPIDLERYNGFKDELTAKYPAMKILTEGDGQFDRDAGLKAMTSILPGYPAIDAVYAQDDEAALGAYNAIKTAKRTDIKVITGFGGTKDAYDLFKAGDKVYTASMSYFPVMGKDGVDLAVKILSGGTVDKKDTIEPTYVVTAANVSQYETMEY
ncbi:MAG: substrate-binding domain-containing protein [Eubacteriales bacterium]